MSKKEKRKVIHGKDSAKAIAMTPQLQFKHQIELTKIQYMPNFPYAFKLIHLSY